MKIVSGGQTGVDRAALDAAMALGLPHGGWCPKGRVAEDGEIPQRYLLKETQSSGYIERTKLNVRDSDGTLIIVASLATEITYGTNLTKEEAEKTGKPLLIVDLSQEIDFAQILAWEIKNHINVLNVAGPRESKSVGIYQQSYDFLKKLLLFLKDS
jgi:hypothetical protein